MAKKAIAIGKIGVPIWEGGLKDADAYTDVSAPLVVTASLSGQSATPSATPFTITHKASGLCVTAVATLHQSRILVALLLKVTDWAVSRDELEKVNKRDDLGAKIKKATEQSEALAKILPEDEGRLEI